MGSSRRHPRRSRPRSIRKRQTGGQTHSHLNTLRRASDIIARLDQELTASLGNTELLRRAVRQCGQANAAISAQLRQLSQSLSARDRNTSAVKTVVQGSEKLGRIATKLTKTLEETRALRGALREAKNELGEARDAAVRAQTDVAELREERKRAGAARAEAALTPVYEKIRELEPLIRRVRQAGTDFANAADGVNWRNWQPQRGDLGTALQPVYNALGLPFTADGRTSVTSAPAGIQAIFAAIAGKFEEAIPDDVQHTLHELEQNLRELSDVVVASIRAVQPAGAPPLGGGRRTRRACRTYRVCHKRKRRQNRTRRR